MKIFSIMVFAALVSAVAWAQAWISDLIIGKTYHKRYLLVSRNYLMGTDEVRSAICDAFAGTPDPGKKKKQYYHHWKDIWPTVLEAARKYASQHPDELMSKYFGFCGVVAGIVLTFLLQTIYRLVAHLF